MKKMIGVCIFIVAVLVAFSLFCCVRVGAMEDKQMGIMFDHTDENRE